MQDAVVVDMIHERSSKLVNGIRLLKISLLHLVRHTVHIVRLLMLLLLLEHPWVVSTWLLKVLVLPLILEVVSSFHSTSRRLLHVALILLAGLERHVSTSAVLVVLVPLGRIVSLRLLVVLCVFRKTDGCS